MSYSVNKKDRKAVQHDGRCSYDLLNQENGCVAGCCTGISEYSTTEYLTPGVHNNSQEGFVVLKGTGWAMVGDEEIRLEPEVSFVAPAGIAHSVKRDADSQPVSLFWFHAAVK